MTDILSLKVSKAKDAVISPSLFCILQEKCAQYWPSDGAVVHGDISIEIKREEESESYTVRDLLVTNNRVRKV